MFIYIYIYIYIYELLHLLAQPLDVLDADPEPSALWHRETQAELPCWHRSDVLAGEIAGRTRRMIHWPRVARGNKTYGGENLRGNNYGVRSYYYYYNCRPQCDLWGGQHGGDYTRA